MSDATRTIDGVVLPAPGTWAIDTSHSSVEFTVRHLVIGKTKGRFTTWSGAVQIAEEPTASSVSIDIDAASIDTNGHHDGHLRTNDFLEVDRHPKLTFTSTTVKGNGKGSVSGRRPHGPRGHQAGRADPRARRGRGEGPVGPGPGGVLRRRPRSTGRTSASRGTRPSRAAACWWARRSRSPSRSRPSSRADRRLSRRPVDDARRPQGSSQAFPLPSHRASSLGCSFVTGLRRESEADEEATQEAAPVGAVGSELRAPNLPSLAAAGEAVRPGTRTLPEALTPV